MSDCRRRNQSARSQQPLRARQHFGHPGVARACDPKRARKRLEYGFDVVMTGSAVQDDDVNVRAGCGGKPLEEIRDQLTLQIADTLDLELQIDHRMWPPAEIDRRHTKRFVHRHDEVAGAIDALAVAERLQRRFTERNAHVLNGVMLIDVEISIRTQRQVEAAVTRKQLEHVVEEADSGPDVVLPLAIDDQLAANLRLRRLAVDSGPTYFCHCPCLTAITSSSAPIAASVCSMIPAVIRMHPAVVGSFDRSRT